MSTLSPRIKIDVKFYQAVLFYQQPQDIAKEIYEKIDPFLKRKVEMNSWYNLHFNMSEMGNFWDHWNTEKSMS